MTLRLLHIQSKNKIKQPRLWLSCSPHSWFECCYIETFCLLFYLFVYLKIVFFFSRAFRKSFGQSVWILRLNWVAASQTIWILYFPREAQRSAFMGTNCREYPRPYQNCRCRYPRHQERKTKITCADLFSSQLMASGKFSCSRPISEKVDLMRLLPNAVRQCGCITVSNSERQNTFYGNKWQLDAYTNFTEICRQIMTIVAQRAEAAQRSLRTKRLRVFRIKMGTKGLIFICKLINLVMETFFSSCILLWHKSIYIYTVTCWTRLHRCMKVAPSKRIQQTFQWQI